MARPALLFLAHRIPFPPNKGDKIRSFHILQHLSKSYRIYLGAFVDDPEDWQYQQELENWCEQVFLLELNPSWRKAVSLTGLLSGEALSIPYYRNAKMRDWVHNCINEQAIETAFLFSSPMAQYLDHPSYHGMRRIMDMVDVDSQKWQAYAERKGWPMSWIYARESRRLLDYERHVARLCDRSLFVSEEEAALFRNLAPESAQRVGSLYNGVDYDHFTPDAELSSPFAGEAGNLVFTGAMDYWANVDAVCWFAEQVLPLIHQQAPETGFYIVGSRPSDEVQQLANRKGVTVTGFVEDVRPYLRHATVAVAPLQIARGIQNKVLEAMSMAVPVVATPAAMEGIGAVPSEHLKISDQPEQMAEHCLSFLQSRPLATAAANREFVLQHFGWDSRLKVLDRELAIEVGKHA